MDRRLFIVSALALSACGVQPKPQTQAAPANLGVASASAERVAADTIRIAWTGMRDPVRILTAQAPDAALPAMQELEAAAPGDAWVGVIPAQPRPYFALEDAEGRVLRVAERLLPLEGGRNFRDLGGYAGAEGKAVRWGRIYRSGVMSELTASDLAYLAALGVNAVCDLRSQDERAREPAPFSGADAPTVVTFDYDMGQTMSSIGALMQAQTREEAVAAFAAGYVQMAQFLAPHFTDLFARLVRDEAPLAMNCSAGKDRTGMASAFVLSVLGVDRDTVIADYALSETYVPPEKYIEEIRNPPADATGSVPPQMAQMFAAMPEPVLRVLLGTDADVMRIALAEIDAAAGGPVGLAKARYGLTDETIATLRSLYLG
jgi:protein-tyrosine phosphatase